MGSRSRLAAALVGALVLVGLAIPVAQARSAAVPRVSGLAAAGSNVTTARLAVKWKKVKGATYQVRFGYSTASLSKAPLIATRTTAAWSQPLSDICRTWYAQVRAKKGGKLGAWSAKKALKFSTSGVTPASPITSGQTSTGQAQVRWVRKPGAAGYRLHYSPGPYGNWPGYFPYTATTAPSATGTAVNLPAVGPGDRMMGAAYGNPLFVQLETKKCSGTYGKTPFTSVWPKAPSAGSAATGSALRFGTYNLELTPTTANNPDKIANIADNIAVNKIDVLALQEANGQTAADLKARLGSAETQGDWEFYVQGQQAVMWRTSEWTLVAGSDQNVGMPTDLTAATPLPTPGVQLTPANADVTRQDIFVVSAHLEDRKKFDSGATIPEQKQDAHDAAVALINKINSVNGGLPTMLAGDLKGNFGGGSTPGAGYCDESSTPKCTGEGQPTFIRNGYLDAQAAVTKVGVQYGTVNKHVANQPGNPIGFGGRADFLVFKGFTGVAKYANVAKTYGDASAAQQPDHNLLYADVFVPFKP